MSTIQANLLNQRRPWKEAVELSLEEEELTIYIKERGSRENNLEENAGWVGGMPEHKTDPGRHAG